MILQTNHFLRSFLQSPESVRTNTSIDEESAEVQCKAPHTVEPCWTYAATSCTQSIHACQWEVKWYYICFIALASALPDPPQPIASDILMDDSSIHVSITRPNFLSTRAPPPRKNSHAKGNVSTCSIQFDASSGHFWDLRYGRMATLLSHISRILSWRGKRGHTNVEKGGMFLI